MPNYHVINAAFTHSHPLGARFSTPERGAWYAAFELATAKAEVIFHKSIEFAEIDWKERRSLDMTITWRISLPPSTIYGGRGRGPKPPQLRAVAATGRGAARAWLAGHHLSSVRREGGTCIACFRPSVVANVRKSTRYRLIWLRCGPASSPRRACQVDRRQFRTT